MAMGSGCVAKTDISCNATDSGCIDSTHAVVCNSTGMGFQAVTCPTGTTCQGFGTCVGTCVVGSSRCNGTDIAQTCTDGFTYEDTYCQPGMTACVETDTHAPVQKASCVAEQCTPNTIACGNLAASATSTDPSYASSCEASPSGYHWQSEKCALASSCFGGSCQAICTPGATRCSINGDGIDTCQADGTWGATAACQATATGAQQVCMNAFYGTSYGAVCGDVLCANGYDGACEADGFHPCIDGKVSTTGAECSIGVCQAGGGNYNGYTAGTCVAQCNPGETKCDGAQAYQTCTAAYRWSGTTSQCATGSCQQYNDTNGLSKTVCGVCSPGSHRCTDNAGTFNANGGTDIETCDAAGQWSAHAACSIGACGDNGYYTGNGQCFGDECACIAQCVPNSTLCLGSTGSPTSTTGNPTHPGTTQYGTCTANGLLPTSGTACPSGFCRRGPSGQPVGTGAAACVVCVGPSVQGGNEVGLVDSYCVATGVGAGQIEICNSGNMWGTTSSCSTATPANGSCHQEQTTYSGSQPQCGGAPAYYGSVCSLSYLEFYYGYDCSVLGGNGNNTVNYGGVSDCCNTPNCLGTTPTSSVSPAACQ